MHPSTVKLRSVILNMHALHLVAEVAVHPSDESREELPVGRADPGRDRFGGFSLQLDPAFESDMLPSGLVRSLRADPAESTGPLPPNISLFLDHGVIQSFPVSRSDLNQFHFSTLE